MRRASLKRVSKRKKEEAISYISSYQTLTADKKSKTYKARTKLKKNGSIYGTIAVNLLTHLSLFWWEQKIPFGRFLAT
jgi:hypothetical protein